ncbi:hypothetical protein NQZ68_015166 [Dissostichus eleginoides]|nr:hypothetical protein NQZ68_015166 [Dissostichus eleginoides]
MRVLSFGTFLRNLLFLKSLIVADHTPLSSSSVWADLSPVSTDTCDTLEVSPPSLCDTHHLSPIPSSSSALPHN